jgi:hypothetical protein
VRLGLGEEGEEGEKERDREHQRHHPGLKPRSEKLVLASMASFKLPCLLLVAAVSVANAAVVISATGEQVVKPDQIIKVSVQNNKLAVDGVRGGTFELTVGKLVRFDVKQLSGKGYVQIGRRGVCVCMC